MTKKSPRSFGEIPLRSLREKSPGWFRRTSAAAPAGDRSLSREPARRTLPSLTAGSLLTLAALLVSACGGDDNIWRPRGSSLVNFSFENLEPLQGGLNYQAWAVEYRSAGYWGSPIVIFNMNEDGEMVDPTTGEVLSGPFEAGVNAEDFYGVQVTLENSNVMVTQPSTIYLMGGQVVDGSAGLGQDTWLSLQIDLSDMSGRYFLATPSDDLPDDEMSGVWFADYAGGTPVQGLDIPQAPEGWDYEAWVVFGNDTLSTGKFYYAAIADTLNPYGGITGNYPFPGQDFLENAPEGLTFPTDLSGVPIFVTLEPWNEYDLEPLSPFPFRLLEATIPLDAVPHTTYQMTSLFSSLPRGTMTVLTQ